ncbi:MAG: beta-galactosidase [Candidatus Brocadiia bacterium]
MYVRVQNILLWVLQILLSATLLPAVGFAAEAEVLQAKEIESELGRVTDLRVVHRGAIEHLQDARTLTVYLAGWGGPDRDPEVEDLMVEAEGLYGLIRGVDYGASGLQAQFNVATSNKKETVKRPAVESLALLQRARRSVAEQVNDFYRRCVALKKDLRKRVRETARQKIQWEITEKAAAWGSPVLERGRRSGLRFGWRLRERDRRTDFFDYSDERKNHVLATGARMGISFVNVYYNKVCNWSVIEKEKGEYDFAPLDNIVKRAHKYGIRVTPMLACLNGSPPEWHLEKEGKDSQFTVLRRRRRREPKKEVQTGINLFHEPTRKAFTRFLTAYARHIRQKWAEQIPAVYAPGTQRELSAPADRSEIMDQFWRRWDRAHGGDGKSEWVIPEEIDRERKGGERAYVRAEMCREDWLIQYVRTVHKALKQGHDELIVQMPTTSDDFHRLFAARTGNSRDLSRLCELTDNPGTSTDSPAGFGVLRSLADGAWRWSQDVHSGCGIIAAAATSNATLHGCVRIAIGEPANSLRAYFPRSWFRYCDWQIGGFGIGSYYLAPMRCQELSALILNTRRADAPIAVLWSQSSLRRDKNSRWFKSAMAWGHLLARSYFQFDYIAENGLAENLKNYRILILPSTHTLPDGVSKTIRQWVRGGGILLGFGAPGLYDEFGVRRKGLPLADVFGAEFAGFRVPAPIRPDRLVTTHPEGSYVSIPPHDYKFEASTYAVLEPTDGKARAFYASRHEQVAIVEHKFGEGEAMLSGYPVGFEYWQAAPYEMGLGLTHHRQLDYNPEIKRYEHWLAKELEKRGVKRELVPAYGRMLRSQRGDDPDWFHIFRNNPEYREYMFETDRPVRAVYAIPRKREGIDNFYVTFTNTQANYLWERGYFVSTLAGGRVMMAVLAEDRWEETPVVFDARLRVPVPAEIKKGRIKMQLVDRGYTAREAKPAHMDGRYLRFETWLPVSRAAGYAIAPQGKVRLFGQTEPDGETPDAVFEKTQACEKGEKLRATEILAPAEIGEFLEKRRGKELLIGCGDRRYRPVGEELATWLREKYNIEAKTTTAGPRATTNCTYMSGFGWTRYGKNPVEADILVGNDQSNGLMWKFADSKDWVHWLPVEVNQDFPGLGHAIVMMSLPVRTRANGQPGGRGAPSHLIIGASNPSDALRAVKEMNERLK